MDPIVYMAISILSRLGPGKSDTIQALLLPQNRNYPVLGHLKLFQVRQFNRRRSNEISCLCLLSNISSGPLFSDFSPHGTPSSLRWV
jgi:hypothetical protein